MKTTSGEEEERLQEINLETHKCNLKKSKKRETRQKVIHEAQAGISASWSRER